jgi:hypothetical protein
VIGSVVVQALASAAAAKAAMILVFMSYPSRSIVRALARTLSLCGDL